MLKFCKILTHLNPVLVYKKPRMHRKIPKPNGPHSLGFSFYSLQILLDPVRRGHPILFFEGSVEDGLAFESGALGDAFDGGGQVSAFAQQGNGMGHTEFIPITGEGGIQFLIEVGRKKKMGDIQGLREVVYREADIYIGLFGF